MKYKINTIFFLLVYSFFIGHLSTINTLKASIIENKSDNNEFSNKNKQILGADIYIIGPGDILKIKFVGVEELSGNFLIMRDGNIQLPLLGTQNINGLTLDQAREKLIELYKNDLLRPEIYISLVSARPLRVLSLIHI